MWWAGTAYFAVQLWWLIPFLGKLFGVPFLGFLATLLYALEGGFLAFVAALVVQFFQSRRARVWALAGGWILLEWTRFFGPFAFPWPTLGYNLLPTPVIQIADLGGVLLGSVLVAATAASLVNVRWGSHRPLVVMTFVWLAALVYGVTRVPGEGPVQPMLALRTTVDQFGAALPRSALFERSRRLTRTERREAEVVVWSESAINDERLLVQAPPDGLYGLSSFVPPRRNTLVAWTGTAVTSQTDKARPVPFGEYFPLRLPLHAAWEVVEKMTGTSLVSLPAAQALKTLVLNDVVYGAYVCYDSVFPWVARQLTREGAEVLVNASNDGWFAGWGVEQHFLMGTVRAIETRRWLVRSVNQGVAGVVDDLGRPRQLRAFGEGVVHAQPRRLTGQSVYMRLGDVPALLLALSLGIYARRVERKHDRHGRMTAKAAAPSS
ncbi:apolipoprotein N-acyltransferase [Deinococcus yavapaiensis KR-236]|uniref:Apolipoprotein N-acyltransferase n=2 Tax=Deinococcus TaxID=1298 RepID=A0A318RYT1_9DEIO|nr:apolipoprotein N-acyltransferase [Deinococcus yavapaiensis KR-236]